MIGRYLAAAAAVCLAIPSAAQNASVPSVIATRPIDRAAIGTILAKAGFRGDVTIVLDGDRQTYVDPDRSARSLLPSRWRWASVTKQMVAILVMQEVAAGRIDLDKPIATYLPRFASPNAATATVRQLLRHQAGLPDPDDTAPTTDAFPAYYLKGYTGSRDPLTGYCAGKPKAPPGGNWAYNNCDYIVAGALLRAVTGKSWDRLFRERIAQPLGLASVGAYPTSVATRIGYYDGKPEPVIDMASYGASAGLYGTPADLVTIDLALIDGKLLPRPQRDEMWDGQPKLGSIALGQWAYDVKLRGCSAPVRLVERRGAIGGVEVRNFIVPARRGAIVMFTDHSPIDFGELWQGKGLSYDLLSAALCPVATP